MDCDGGLSGKFLAKTTGPDGLKLSGLHGKGGGYLRIYPMDDFRTAQRLKHCLAFDPASRQEYNDGYI